MPIRQAILRIPFTVALLAAMACGPAHAVYSGLFIIPTADVMTRGQMSFELQLDGGWRLRTADTRIINTQFGLGGRFEAGADLYMHETPATPVFNFKYSVPTGKSAPVQVAAGLINYGERRQGTGFVAATRDLKRVRLHAGLLRTPGINQAFMGTDFRIRPNLLGMADYVTGPTGLMSMGVGYTVDKTKSVLLGAMFGNRGGEARYTCHFVFALL